MKPTLKKRLLDALEARHAIQDFVAGRAFTDYERNLMLRSAVERQFEIIGEALNQAEIEQPPRTRLTFGEIPFLPQLLRLTTSTC